jgi:hypothetical protein
VARLAVAAAVIGLFLVTYYWGNQFKHPDSVPPGIEGVLVRPPIDLPAFQLRDARGPIFTGEDFAGHWTLLAFGDLSRASGHLAIMRMIEVHNRLASDFGLQNMLLLALASERQEPALALDFGRLSPALKVLSAGPGDLQRLRASVGAPPLQGAPGARADEAPLYLIGPSGRLVALFPGAQMPASIASDLSAIANRSDALYPTSNDHSGGLTPRNYSREPHDRFSYPEPFPKGEEDLDPAARGLAGDD